MSEPPDYETRKESRKEGRRRDTLHLSIWPWMLIEPQSAEQEMKKDSCKFLGDFPSSPAQVRAGEGSRACVCLHTHAQLPVLNVPCPRGTGSGHLPGLCSTGLAADTESAGTLLEDIPSALHPAGGRQRKQRPQQGMGAWEIRSIQAGEH